MSFSAETETGSVNSDTVEPGTPRSLSNSSDMDLADVADIACALGTAQWKSEVVPMQSRADVEMARLSTDQLVAVLTGMKWGEAARVVAQMDQDRSAMVLARLHSSDAGVAQIILAALDDEMVADMLAEMQPFEAALILMEMQLPKAGKCLAHMKSQISGQIVKFMSSDAAVKSLRSMCSHESVSILSEMSAEMAAAVLEEMEWARAAEVLRDMQEEIAAGILSRMPVKIAVSILGLFNAVEIRRILDKTGKESAAQIAAQILCSRGYPVDGMGKLFASGEMSQFLATCGSEKEFKRMLQSPSPLRQGASEWAITQVKWKSRFCAWHMQGVVCCLLSDLCCTQAWQTIFGTGCSASLPNAPSSIPMPRSKNHYLRLLKATRVETFMRTRDLDYAVYILTMVHVNVQRTPQEFER